jgi:ABC-type iron transport system FetAB ATPase subunit
MATISVRYIVHDVDAAIAHFEECLRLDPGHDRARRNLAAARQRRR